MAELGHLVATRLAQYANTGQGTLFVLAGLGGISCGFFVALAGNFPWPIAISLISVSVVIWVIATVLLVSLSFLKWAPTIRRWRIPVAVMIVSASIAALARSTSLYIAQISSGNPSITWNVDYRYHLMHTQSLIYSEGTGSLLIASGIPISYHIGPAWVAASLYETLSLPIEFTSFALVPALSLIWLMIGLVTLLKYLGARTSVALIAIGIAVAGPFLWDNSFQRLQMSWGQEPLIGAIISENQGWYFGPNLMLNTFFALGVIGAALSLLLRSESPFFSGIAGIGVGVTLVLKPQYMIATVCLVFALIVLEVVARKHRNKKVVPLLVFSAGVGLSALLISQSSAWGRLSSGRQFTFVWGGEDMFALEYLVGFTGLFAIAALVIGGDGILRSIGMGTFTPQFRTELLLFFLAIGTLAIIGFFRFADVLIESSTLSLSVERDALQGVTLLLWVMLPLIVSWLGESFVGQKTLFLVVTVGIGLLGASLQFGQVVHNVTRPETGYEYVDASDVTKVLSGIERTGSLLLASDIADPTENYRRPGDAWHIVATTRVPFWFGGYRYELETNPEAQSRLAIARTFFGSQWSAWHNDFLMEKGITHVLISKRCEPVWFANLEKSNEIRESELWFLVEAKTLSLLPQGPVTSEDEVRLPEPLYGVSPCMGGDF